MSRFDDKFLAVDRYVKKIASSLFVNLYEVATGEQVKLHKGSKVTGKDYVMIRKISKWIGDYSGILVAMKIS